MVKERIEVGVLSSNIIGKEGMEATSGTSGREKRQLVRKLQIKINDITKLRIVNR